MKHPIQYVVNLNEVNSSNLDIVGGKNASTGEMIQNLSKAGIRVRIEMLDKANNSIFGAINQEVCTIKERETTC